MCGRFTNAGIAAADLQERFELGATAESFVTSHNVKPTQTVPVVVLRDGQPVLEQMRWGLVPGWAKDAAIGSKMFNARAETVDEKPSFRNAFRRRRCLVPARGFYEWRSEGGRKVPYRFGLANDEIFAFAGLFESWRGGEGEGFRSFTIITTAPNELVAPVHDRMPVILRRDAEALWLDPQFPDTAYLQSLLAAYPADAMQIEPVTTPL